MPKDYHYESIAALRSKRDEVLFGDELAVGEIASGIVQDLFGATPGSLDQRLTYGMLPKQAQKLYRIDWTDQDQEDHDRLTNNISFLNRSLPKGVRYVPAWNHAQNRIAQSDCGGEAKGGRFSLFQKGKEQSAGLYMRLLGIDSEPTKQPEA